MKSSPISMKICEADGYYHSQTSCKKWGVAIRSITYYLMAGRIPGAVKKHSGFHENMRSRWLLSQSDKLQEVGRRNPLYNLLSYGWAHPRRCKKAFRFMAAAAKMPADSHRVKQQR
jgi:hypothetical protein